MRIKKYLSYLILLFFITFLVFTVFNITGLGVVNQSIVVSKNITSSDQIRPCGCECSPPAKVLMILDDNNHGEDVQDFDKIYQDLKLLGADVTKINEPTNGLTYDMIKNYQLVWFSNPGWSIDDPSTIDALQQHLNNNKPVIFQGDDMTWSMDHKFDSKVEDFTGLKNVNNGQDSDYKVIFSDREHPLLNLLKGQQITYKNDDIDSSLISKDDVAILAYAWNLQNPTAYKGPAIVLRDFTEQNKGALLVVLMTLTEIEPESKREALVSNIVNWMLIKTQNCICPESVCGIGYEKFQNGAWSSCIIPQPQAEVCDGLDNDCNGQIDEKLTKCCESKDVNGKVTCVGIEKCEKGKFTECLSTDGKVCPVNQSSYLRV